MFGLPEPWGGALHVLVVIAAVVPPVHLLLQASIYGEFRLLEHTFDRYQDNKEFWIGVAAAVAWLGLAVLLLN